MPRLAPVITAVLPFRFIAPLLTQLGCLKKA
jgi:hypothetical protein